MEDIKKTYQDELLVGVGSPAEILNMCREKVSDSFEKVRKYYFGKKVSDLLDDELAEMMVMDACFILQFIVNLSIGGNLFSNNRLRSRNVALDLVLLENQIPYFVLQEIYDLTLKVSKPETTDLISMLYDLLERVNPFLDKLKLENHSVEKPPYHILGLLHEFYDPNTSDPPNIEAILKVHSDSAVGLHKVGVRFRPNQNMTWPLAMEFEQSTLRMPRVLIDNFFEVVMRNLIAYEQYSYGVKNYVASYAMALDMLDATPADIAKLAESDVLVSNMGSYEKASNMISSICKDVTFLDFYYIECWQKVKNHTDSYWSTNFAVLKRKYFGTIWKAIALFVGIILFAVAVIQFAFRIVDFTEFH
ncbi:UPF0481 protein At3g47200-like [Bidens hawaiensis]|uniref:UPF0481 protein At3g47200-like n=1 Tax=Bidens hawaiensis TaxID=980011 RepID=UPI004049AC36